MVDEKKTPVVAKKKKGGAAVTSRGKLYITATFNNTLVTITNDKGETVTWSSSGSKGYKGTRKSTPYAASVAVEDAAKRAMEMGIKAVDVFVKGPGAGRDSGLRAVKTAGLSISSISDITPLPHNGPKAKKKRRV
ncbi:MAG: 30S ribosomal protein S11 [Patescibacteria group bacterium]|nr:30S ribosomal protein S11 [Patescibacteria group bacterium]MDE2589099.1 30S ribosomal protein S11 [Patescibacteria group bacterium]